ncbi:C40 family peptidase [Leptodesmis sp.]|uniref:C40 family peptidase n=1 Tax=Leptodesmis sp. TaxID=3100501 RepID=UPI00405353BB
MFPSVATSLTANVQYQCRIHLDIYDSPALERLATQATAGRQLWIESPADTQEDGATAIAIRLCEDDYPGWIGPEAVEQLDIAETPYQPTSWSAAEIQAKIPEAIAFTKAAMAHPNHYLWGGTVGPNYDCSGLIQAAFASVGIWLPRDAYQQEEFAQAIALADAQPGDLVFFGPAQKATHVGLYLGNGQYIHSSGKDQGHNGIAIDPLSATGTPISQTYFAQFRGVGRIQSSYQAPRRT